MTTLTRYTDIAMMLRIDYLHRQLQAVHMADPENRVDVAFLINLIVASGVTQSDVSKAAKLSPSVICRIAANENGRPDRRNLARTPGRKRDLLKTLVELLEDRIARLEAELAEAKRQAQPRGWRKARGLEPS